MSILVGSVSTVMLTSADLTAATEYLSETAGTSFSVSYTILVYFLVPSQKPVPASKSLGARKASGVLTVVILQGESIGTRMASKTSMPRMMLPATEAWFFRNRFIASLKKVVGFVSSFLSVTLVFC